MILVRWETTPDDIHGMIAAKGILTAHGGMTSHAAVVARGMGKPCVAGCEALSVDHAAKKALIAGHELGEGDVITRINRVNVTTLADFQRMLSALKPGDPIVLNVSRYQRDGDRIVQRIVQFTYQ